MHCINFNKRKFHIIFFLYVLRILFFDRLYYNSFCVCCMFTFLKETFSEGLKKIKDSLGSSENIHDIDAIEKALLSMNFMPELVTKIVSKIRQVDRPWKEVLREELYAIFSSVKKQNEEKEVVILIGINGSGKTTSAVKFARQNNHKKTLLVPADTFRAAAKNQLEELAESYHIDFFNHNLEVPSSVIYQSAAYAKEHYYEKVIIDTAGRIHQNQNLIKELVKSIQTAKKQFGREKCTIYLVLDGLQGKNLLEQVTLFSEEIMIDGIIITKLDAGVKPGIIFSIVSKFMIPLVYLSYGQKEVDLLPFKVNQFIEYFLT